MPRNLIIALVLILITVIFSIQNSSPITMKFFFWDINYPPAVLIPLAVLIGAVLGLIFSLTSIKRKNEKIERLEKELKEKGHSHSGID